MPCKAATSSTERRARPVPSLPIFREGRFEAAMTMMFFVAAMKLDAANEAYLGDLQQTSDRRSAELCDKRLSTCRIMPSPRCHSAPETLSTRYA